MATITAPSVGPMDAPITASESAAIEVHDLVRQFGSFTAVDHLTFTFNKQE